MIETILLSSAVFFSWNERGCFEHPCGQCKADYEIVESSYTEAGCLKYEQALVCRISRKTVVLSRKLIGLCDDGVVRWKDNTPNKPVTPLDKAERKDYPPCREGCQYDLRIDTRPWPYWPPTWRGTVEP